MKSIPLRFVADVRTSSVDKHTHEGELPVQLCNYVDVYRKDVVRPGPDLMRATASQEEINRFRLQVGDTVLTKDSEDPAEMGVSAYIDQTADDFVCGYHLAIARPVEATHSKFLTWVLRSRPVLDHFTAHSSGISRYGLSLSGLRSTPIPVKDWDEQRRIADFLDDRVARIDQIITARRRQTASLFERFRHQVVMEASRHERVPLRRLLAAVRTGTTPADAANDPNGSAWYSPGSFGESLELGAPARRVTPVGLPRFEAGSVLLVGIGATAGKVAWLRTPATGNQQVTCLVPDRHRLDGRFLLHQLAVRTDELLKTAPFATLPIINNEAIRAFELWCAELATQERLSRAWDADLTNVISLRDTLGNSVALLTEYKQSLITAAVSGDLDVSTAGSAIPG